MIVLTSLTNNIFYIANFLRASSVLFVIYIYKTEYNKIRNKETFENFSYNSHKENRND